MIPQKTKEEFPITRILKKGASIMIVPLAWTQTLFHIIKWESSINVTVNSRWRVIELTNNGIIDRWIWWMIRKWIKRWDKFCWTTYVANEDK